ncbi:hypothetical protein PV02_10120 [Methanolobus chelungpuianus]|uniref:Uncharacterized protein n=1 Tax=Methanolobus chelungpuianus TaxID=502115 RepID=A0AAE3HBV5_9EURY|nr:hypothetical protein [Methanolobus chelungpuianus]
MCKQVKYRKVCDKSQLALVILGYYQMINAGFLGTILESIDDYLFLLDDYFTVSIRFLWSILKIRRDYQLFQLRYQYRKR